MFLVFKRLVSLDNTLVPLNETHINSVIFIYIFINAPVICNHCPATYGDQDQDQDSLLVKRRNDNHSPGPVIRELVPSSHQRSELSNTILCIFSG